MKMLRLSVLVFLAAAQLGAAFGFAHHGGVGTARPRLHPSRLGSPKAGADGRVTGSTGTTERSGPLASSAEEITRDTGLVTWIGQIWEKSWEEDATTISAKIQSKKIGTKLDALLSYKPEERLITALKGADLWDSDVNRVVDALKEFDPTWAPSTSSTEVQRPMAAPSKARVLGVDDFLPVEEVRKKPLLEMTRCGSTLPANQPEFVNKRWLTETGTAINNLVDKVDDDATGQRVSPSALIGCSRAGKTRALREIGLELRQKYNRPVVYVSFNDATTYQLEEAASSSPLDSLLARIAYAIAKPEVLAGERLHDDEGLLSFTTNRTCLVEWLKRSNDCVLLIDEINNLVNSAMPAIRKDPVAFFLRDNFISTAGRGWVCTTHVTDALTVFDSIGGNPSGRVFLRHSLPVVESEEDLKKLVYEGRRLTVHPAYYGLSPGLIMTSLDKGYELDRKWELALEKLSENEMSVLFGEILLDLFNPNATAASFRPSFELLSRCVYAMPESRVVERAWPPVALGFVLSRCDAPMLSDPVRARAQELIGALRDTSTRGGRAWEITVSLALILRLEALRCRSQKDWTSDMNIQLPGKRRKTATIFPSGLIEDLRCGQNVRITCRRDWDDVGEALAKLRRAPDQRPAATVYFPGRDDFGVYDLLLAYYPAGDKKSEIYGYQFKSGKNPPKRALPAVAKSFLIRGVNVTSPGPDTETAKQGWIVIGKEDRNRLLGPSLLPLLQFERPL